MSILSCSETDNNEILAVYKSTFHSITPSTSVETEEYSVFSIDQLKEIFNPIVTTEKSTITQTTESEELTEDITLTLKESFAILDIKADAKDKTHIFDVENEILTFSEGEFSYNGIKLFVKADGIFYNSMAVGGEITERNIFELEDYRYVREVSRQEKSVKSATNKKDFHSEVSYNQPLVALRFTDGAYVYKCSIEDQETIKMERIEPDYLDYGLLNKVK